MPKPPTVPALKRSRTPILPWLLFAALEVCAIAVFWAFDALPFMDLPAHAGAIALRNAYSTSDFLRQYFVLDPHLGGYSAFRFLGDHLAKWIGPMDAIRTLASLPVVILPAAALYARKRLYGDIRPFVAFIALILCFGFMTILGFASYMISLAILAIALAEWLVLMAKTDAGETTFGQESVNAGLAILILVSHGFAFIVFGFLAFVTALSTGARYRRILRLRAFVPATLVASHSLWVERTSVLPDGGVLPPVSLTPVFQGVLDKLSLLATPALMTRTGIDILIAAMLWLIVVVAAVRFYQTFSDSNPSIQQMRHTRALMTASASTFLLFLVSPYSVGWFGFVDGRLLPVAILTAILTLNPDDFSVRFRRVGSAAVQLGAATTVALALFASSQFQQEASGASDVLARVPASSRLLYFPLKPDSRIFTGHPFVHYNKLVLLQRSIVPSDLWFHQGTAVYPTRINPALSLPVTFKASDLKAIAWPGYNLQDWDYVLIRTSPDSSVPQYPPSLALVFHRNGWWLLRTPAAPKRPATPGVDGRN